MKLLLVLLCCTISVATCTYDQCFRAAVYEHVKFSSVKENLDVFEQVAATASENGVQIVVFPENGVFTPLPVRDVALNNMEYIPNINGQDVKPVPCDEKEIYANRTILYRLSCSAKKHKMYIVADMGDYQPCDITTDKECPKDGFYLYNTQVAFGPKGNLIAKYHKRHLYGEFVYNTPEDELVYFDTPFGRFGMFICFDIIFKVPGVDLVRKYNVTTMLFSTHWFDEQPFLTSVHYHHSWAYANKVNLLSANLKAMRTASTGSGLYSSNSPLVTEHSVKGSSYSKLLISTIPSKYGAGNSCSADPVVVEFKHKVDSTKYNDHNMIDLSQFPSRRLNAKMADKIEHCHNGISCLLNYKLSHKDDVNQLADFRLIAFNGSHFGNFSWCEEICALVRYDSELGIYSTTGLDFDFLEISARPSSATKFYPTIVGDDYAIVSPRKWIYGNDSLAVRSERISRAFLYGRCYDRD